MRFRRLGRLVAMVAAVVVVLPLTASEVGDTMPTKRASIFKPVATTTTTATSTTLVSRSKPDETPEDLIAKAIFEMVNVERTRRGLAPLGWSSDLAKPAERWSASMGASGDLVHQDLNDVIVGRNPKLVAIGENILEATDTYTSAELHKAWMDSPGHRANILKPDFNQVGIAVACTKDGRVFATQEFGTAREHRAPIRAQGSGRATSTRDVADSSESCAG